MFGVQLGVFLFCVGLTETAVFSCCMFFRVGEMFGELCVCVCFLLTIMEPQVLFSF